MTAASKIVKYNLDKDKNVLGKNWLLTYGGYFSDEENIKLFIKAIKPYLPKKNLDILYAASASGLLGEKLMKSLGQGQLTIVDVSAQHLNENKNPKTTKVRADLLNMRLRNKFDLIIMRSSLDYFPSEKLQTHVLKIIKTHLRKDGLFVNQPAYIPDPGDRNTISLAYNSSNKIGKRFFQSSDITDIYKKSGFTPPQLIGKGKQMLISDKDHIKRYQLDREDIDNIRAILKKAKIYASVTPKGYKLKFEFPIFLSKSL